MLRIHFLQQWYGLSDPAMEEALQDTPEMRRFAQLGGLNAVPDEATTLNFRRLLETHGLAAKMLAKVNAHLSRAGLSLRAGTIGERGRNKRDRERVERWKHQKASLRTILEHPLRVITRQFGYVKVRYRGLAKNAAQVSTLFALSNLWMTRKRFLPTVGGLRL